MDIDERYVNGKIYKIVCKETDEVYYGSTIQELNKRMNRHRNDKCCVSKQIIDRNNYYYELVEDYSCNNRKELETKERWYIENNECINKHIPTRTIKEYYQQNKEHYKEYRENNKGKVVEYLKEYYQQNKEKQKEKQKEYYQQNKEKRLEQMKNWRDKNKDKILDKIKETTTCPICGDISTKYKLKKHQQSKKCLSKIEKLNTKTI